MNSATQLFILCCLSLAGGTVFLCMKCFFRYDMGLTYIETTITTQDKTVMPVVTFCFLNHEEIRKHFNTDEVEWYHYVRRMSMGVLTPTKADEHKYNPNFTKSANQDYEGEDLYYLVSRRKDQKHCFTLDPPQDYLDIGFKSIKFRLIYNASQHYKVYFHDPALFHEAYNQYGVNVNDPEGRMATYQISYTETNLIERKETNKTCLHYPLDYDNLNTTEKMIDPLFKPCRILQFQAISTGGYTGNITGIGDPFLQLFYSKLIYQGQEKELYVFTEMVGESGGYVGVVLGFSILDLSLLAKTWLEKKYKSMKEEFATTFDIL